MKFNLNQMKSSSMLEELENKNKKKKRSNKEERLQSMVCRYMKLKYPGTLFDCDTAAGLNLGMKWNVLKKLYRSDQGFPDFTIYAKTKDYCGLKLELKKHGEKIYKKDGTLRKDEHLEQQDLIQHRLRGQGWDAKFSVGFEQTKQYIDEYMAMHREHIETTIDNLIIAVM